MDQSVGLIRKAGASLRVLAREFDGLERERIERLMADDFLGTLDFLFDNKFNNHLFTNRVYDTIDRVHEALETVEQTRQKTDQRAAELDAQLAEVGRRRERLLTQVWPADHAEPLALTGSVTQPRPRT